MDSPTATPAADIAAATVASDTANADEQPPAPAQQPDAELAETAATGRLVSVEDGPYPMFVLTLQFSDQAEPQDFNVNVEAMDVDWTKFEEWIDRDLDVRYQTTVENHILALHCEGKAVEGYAEKIDPTWFQIYGTLEGATEASIGDLPDEFSVTDAAGNTVWFTDFFGEELVAVNGKTVDAYYVAHRAQALTAVALAGE